MVELNEYQKRAMTTRSANANSLEYMTLGLVGEAGEVANKVKKILRGDYAADDPELVATLRDEIGDCLWYVAGLVDVLGLELDDVAQRNLEKLADRKERGVIKGNGDLR